jgi:hypothetical protein
MYHAFLLTENYILLNYKSYNAKHRLTLTLSRPNRWETDKIVSFVHIKFIMRA